MIEVNIPGMGTLHLKHLVLDYNGTIAFDGNLIRGIEEKINQLADDLKIHIITADTFGTVNQKCRNIKGKMKVLTTDNGSLEKEEFVDSLGAENVVAVGNGINDSLMLKKAALGIVVIGSEGAAQKTIKEADIVVKDIHNALGLLSNRLRLIATLRV